MLPDELSSAGHAAAIGSVAAAYFGWLSPLAAGVAAILGALYWALSLYEMRTVQNWKLRFIQARRTKKLAKLHQAAVKRQIAQITALEKLRADKVEASELVATAADEAKQLVIHAAADAKL